LKKFTKIHLKNTSIKGAFFKVPFFDVSQNPRMIGKEQSGRPQTGVNKQKILRAYQTAEPDKNTGADKAGNQISETAGKSNTEKAEYKTSERCAHNTKNDIHNKAGVAFHKCFCCPASQSANDDRGNPTYTCVMKLGASRHRKNCRKNLQCRLKKCARF